MQGFAWEHSTCARDQHQGSVMKIILDEKKKLGIYKQMQSFLGECNGFVKVLLVNAKFPSECKIFASKSKRIEIDISSHILKQKEVC